MIRDVANKMLQSEEWRIMSLVEEVYGSRQRARDWMNTPKARLEGRAPNDLLKSAAGRRRIEELLIQISEGMFI
jgi:uncharacterized protein (DUF2384 family)